MGELKRTASEFLNVPQEELIFRHREIYSSKDESKKMTYPELMGAMGKNGRLAVGAGYYNPKTTYLNPADMSGVPYEVYPTPPASSRSRSIPTRARSSFSSAFPRTTSARRSA